MLSVMRLIQQLEKPSMEAYSAYLNMTSLCR